MNNNTAYTQFAATSVLHPLPLSPSLCLFLQASEAKAKEEVEKRKEEAEAKLTMQVSALNENVATLKREWQSSQRRVSELEKQTDELRGEIAVLEATVQNNQDERRALLERLGTTYLPFLSPFLLCFKFSYTHTLSLTVFPGALL